MVFNDFNVVNREVPVNVPAQSTQVGDTHKYEGKDNPGNLGYYRRQEKKKDEPEKKQKPKGDHKVDLVA